MKFKKCLKYVNFIIIIFFILVESFLILKKEFQNDTFYSIRVGEQLIQNGFSSFRVDTFSWHEGLEYCNPHWLNDCLIYLSFSLGNFFGIYLLTYIEICILGILIFCIANYECKNKWVSCVITLFCIYILQSFLAARAQLLSYIIFALEVFALIKYSRKNQKRYIALLCVLALILANAHAAVFPIYLVLFLLFIAEEIIGKILFRKSNSSKNEDCKSAETSKQENCENSKVLLGKIEITRSNNLKKLILIFIVVCLIGLINPSGLTPYTYILKSASRKHDELSK